jgi:pyrophosphate--fructose-6-phosphate 1-phosphotransferase
MGRSASHITLECALQCRPTYAFIGEEVQAKNLSLQDLVDNLIKIITQRSKNGKDFGIILVPEGLIEFIPEVNKLIQEINQILS